MSEWEIKEESPFSPKEYATQFFVERGWEPHHAAGIAGNLYYESEGLNPQSLEKGGRGRGIAQWDSNRYRGLSVFARSRQEDMNALDTQLEYVHHELNGSERAAGDSLRLSKTPEEAAKIFSEQYERPGVIRMGQRIAHSNDAYLRTYGPKAWEPTGTEPQPQESVWEVASEEPIEQPEEPKSKNLISDAARAGWEKVGNLASGVTEAARTLGPENMPEASMLDSGNTESGLPIREASESENTWFQQNPQVGGMADFESDTIVLNPFSKLSKRELEAVANNEAARLVMRRDNLVPNFSLTPEQEKEFKTYGGGDELARRETIIGRIISGDPSALNITPEQKAFAEDVKRRMFGEEKNLERQPQSQTVLDQVLRENKGLEAVAFPETVGMDTTQEAQPNRPVPRTGALTEYGREIEGKPKPAAPLTITDQWGGVESSLRQRGKSVPGSLQRIAEAQTKEVGSQIEQTSQQLNAMEEKLNKLKSSMESTKDPKKHNALVTQFNALVPKYNAMVEKGKLDIDRFNKLANTVDLETGPSGAPYTDEEIAKIKDQWFDQRVKELSPQGSGLSPETELYGQPLSKLKSAFMAHGQKIQKADPETLKALQEMDLPLEEPAGYADPVNLALFAATGGAGAIGKGIKEIARHAALGGAGYLGIEAGSELGGEAEQALTGTDTGIGRGLGGGLAGAGIPLAMASLAEAMQPQLQKLSEAARLKWFRDAEFDVKTLEARGSSEGRIARFMKRKYGVESEYFQRALHESGRSTPEARTVETPETIITEPPTPKQPEPGAPASTITDATKVNDITMGQVEQRILGGNVGIRDELGSILEQRIKTEGDAGLSTFQDWMNPGKVGARIHAELMKEGMSSKDARVKLGELMKDYEWKYNEVIAKHRGEEPVEVPVEKPEKTAPEFIETEQGTRPQKEVDQEQADQLRRDMAERKAAKEAQNQPTSSRFPDSYVKELYSKNIVQPIAASRRAGFEEVLGRPITNEQTESLMIEMMQQGRDRAEEFLISDASPIQPDWAIKEAWEAVAPRKDLAEKKPEDLGAVEPEPIKASSKASQPKQKVVIEKAYSNQTGRRFAAVTVDGVRQDVLVRGPKDGSVKNDWGASFPYEMTSAAEIKKKAVEKDLKAKKQEQKAEAKPKEKVGETLASQQPQRVQAPPTPSTPKPEPIPEGSKRSAIIKEISKAFSVPIRIGRFRNKAAGIYKLREKVIRLKRPNDVEVAVHEVAHHFESLLGLSRRMPDEVRAMAYAGAKSTDREGFAEFVRYYVTQPQKAQTEAPNFYKTFESKLKDFPDVQEVLVGIRQAWQIYQASPSVAKVGSFIVSGAEKRRRFPTMNQLYTALKDEIYPLRLLEDAVKKRTGKDLRTTDRPYLMAWAMRGWAREVEQYWKHGTFQLSEAGATFTGPSLRDILLPIEFKGLRPLLDSYLVAKRALNDERVIEGFSGILSRGDFEQTVKELEPQFKDVAEKLYKYSDELVTFLTQSERMSDDLADRIRKKNVFYTPLYRVMDNDAPIGGLSRKKFGNLFQPIRTLHGSSRDIFSPTESLFYNTIAIINVSERNRIGTAMIKLSKIEGMGDLIERLPVRMKPTKITKDDFLSLLARYATTEEIASVKQTEREITSKLDKLAKTPSGKMDKVVHEALTARGWTNAEATQIVERVKSADSSEQTGIIEKTVEKTTIMVVKQKLGFQGMPDELIANFRPNYNTGPNEVIFYNKGEPEIYELAPELYSAIMSADSSIQNFVVKALSFPAKLLRAGATTALEFVLRNPVKDQLTAFVFSDYSYKPFLDLARGIFHILKADEIYQLFNVGGAAHATMVSPDREYLKEKIDDILKKRNIPYFAKEIISNPLKLMQAWSELTEEATRVGEYARAIKMEGKTFEGIKNSSLAARDVTLDFGRIGAQTRAINSMVAFWNVALEGTDKMVRSFKKHPVRTLWKSLIAYTLPSLLLWYAQKDDPAYQEMPYWRRILFWNIVTHNKDGSTKHIWSWPKSFELGILFGSLPEMIIESARQNDPEAVEQTTKKLFETLLPGILPTGLLPIVEWTTNKSWFFDKPIVPRDKEGLRPSLQYNPHTSEAVKLLAFGMEKIPVLRSFASPAKIENLIYGYTAGVGRMTLEGVDAILKKTKIVDVPPDPSMTLADVPGIRGFAARYPSANTRSIEDFYRRYTRRKVEYESLKEDAGIRGISKLDPKMKLKKDEEMKAMETAAQSLSVMRMMADLTYKSKGIDSESKRVQLDNIYYRMINIARIAMGRSLIVLPPEPKRSEVK